MDKDYFNPRSHERSDLLMPKLWHKKRISIHAPTRGATFILHTHCPMHFNYFNPRSHERSDGIAGAILQNQVKFQSTLPREERLFGLYIRDIISIFQSTLPREERPYSNGWILFHFYFNPRSHERSDRRMIYSISI